VRAVKLDSPGTIIEPHNFTRLLIYLHSLIDTLYLMYEYFPLHLQYVAVIIKKKRINFNILIIHLDVSYLTTYFFFLVMIKIIS
jgi:hypothetical protein